jgi:hypothetical protein
MSLPSELDVRVRHEGPVAVARPVGTLDVTTYPSLRDVLLKSAAEQPDAVIVELDWLDLPAPHAISVFSLVSMRVAEWPGLPVLLVAERLSQRSLLHASGVGRFVRIFDAMPAAMAAVGEQPTRRRAVLLLGHGPACPLEARRFVRETCYRWGVDVAGQVALIVTELVENSMVHTMSDASVRLELRSSILTVAVSDADPRPPFLRERLAGGVPERDADRGRSIQGVGIGAEVGGWQDGVGDIAGPRARGIALTNRCPGPRGTRQRAYVGVRGTSGLRRRR